MLSCNLARYLFICSLKLVLLQMCSFVSISSLAEPRKYIPAVVVGVVGMGHVPGIEKNWNSDLNIQEIMRYVMSSFPMSCHSSFTCSKSAMIGLFGGFLVFCHSLKKCRCCNCCPVSSLTCCADCVQQRNRNCQRKGVKTIDSGILREGGVRKCHCLEEKVCQSTPKGFSSENSNVVCIESDHNRLLA